VGRARLPALRMLGMLPGSQAGVEELLLAGEGLRPVFRVAVFVKAEKETLNTKT